MWIDTVDGTPVVDLKLHPLKYCKKNVLHDWIEKVTIIKCGSNED